MNLRHTIVQQKIGEQQKNLLKYETSIWIMASMSSRGKTKYKRKKPMKGKFRDNNSFLAYFQKLFFFI